MNAIRYYSCALLALYFQLSVSLGEYNIYTHTISLIILDNLNIHIQHHSVLVIAFCVPTFSSFGDFFRSFLLMFFHVKVFCLHFIHKNHLKSNKMVSIEIPFYLFTLFVSIVFHPPCHLCTSLSRCIGICSLPTPMTFKLNCRFM